MSNTKNRRAPGRMRRAAAAGAVTFAGMALLAAPAGADPVEPIPVPGGAACVPEYGMTCVSVVVNEGTFNNNGFVLPISDGDMIIAGTLNDDPNVEIIQPRDDGHLGLYSKAMTVPGGVLGIDLPFNNLFGLAGVTAQVEALEVPKFNGYLTNFDMTLKVRMKINNAFLGDNCYLGSAENPVVMHLEKTNALDDQPTATSGAPFHPDTVELAGIKNSATDFSIPEASGCGPFGVLNPIVNWRAKVPATGGTTLTTRSSGYLSLATDGGTDPLDGIDGGTGSLASMSGSSGSS